MYILSVDTALGQESCAILKDGEIIAFSHGTGNSLQAEKLFEHINGALAEAKLKFEDINYYAADLGPGSFTGIRIGLSAIIAVNFAQGKEFVGVSSLEALAYKIYDGNKDISVAINAGREEAYFQEFVGVKAKGAPMLKKLGKIREASVGNIAACRLQAIPDARDIGKTAYKMIVENIADFNRKSPIYVRAPDAKIQTKVI